MKIWPISTCRGLTIRGSTMQEEKYLCGGYFSEVGLKIVDKRYSHHNPFSMKIGEFFQAWK